MDFTAPSFSLGIDFDDPPPLAAESERRAHARGYAAPDAPSFSLGIDFEGDGGGGGNEPHLPAGSRREEHARPYEAADAPSFSLGIDDEDGDFVAGRRRHEQARPQVAPGPPSSLFIDDEDDDFFLAAGQRPERARGQTLDPDPLPPPPEASRFKRLRRGPALPPLASTPRPPPPRAPAPAAAEATPVLSGKTALGAVGSLEDEIEDFTDEERPARDVPPSVGSCSASSNSKFSLLNHGALMGQSTSKAKIPKLTQMPNSSASKPLQESCLKKLLPKITISPMRKIHLLDSDTDSDDNKSQNKAKKQQSSKSQGSNVVQKSEAKINDSWATSALDEFCNEYFKSVKDSRQSQQKEGSSFGGSKFCQTNCYVGEIGGHCQHQSSGAVLDDNLADSHPPALYYYFNHDPMVRKLVHERLQHFIPIGAESTRENEQCGAENLNYRSQFGQSGAASDRWVTPKKRAYIPTDAGKRRVHAGGTQSGSGRWFTGEDGQKVYVSKNGQELTGRVAYRQYKKESGRGFRKSKKRVQLRKKVQPELNEVVLEQAKLLVQRNKAQLERKGSDKINRCVWWPGLRKGQGFAVISYFVLCISSQSYKKPE